jgi:hypothetical protein
MMNTEKFWNLFLSIMGYFISFGVWLSLFTVTTVPTACVGFNKEGNCIEFLINKKFWDEQSLNITKNLSLHTNVYMLLILMVNGLGKKCPI